MPPDRVSIGIRNFKKINNRLWNIKQIWKSIDEENVKFYDWKTSVNDIVKSPRILKFKFSEIKGFILKQNKKRDLIKF